jgi:transcription elongation factor Elf1
VGSTPAGGTNKYNMQKTQPLCWVPYYSIEVNPYGGARPCCKFIGPTPYDENFISDFFSEKLAAWRKDHFEGDSLLEGCRACDVPANNYSFRKFSEDNYRKTGWTAPVTHQLKKVTIALDNVCASSCVMCGSHFSTTIGNLLKSADIKTYHRFVEINKENPVNSKSNFEEIENHLDDLEIVHLYGGEPLMSPNFLKFIDIISKAPKLRILSFSTGLKQIKESHIQAIKEQLSQCNIYATVSIDAPLDLNHWIRGIDEAEYKEKFALLSKYVVPSGFQITIGAYNVFALPECVETIKKIWPVTKTPTLMSSPIIAPEQLRVAQLPLEIKQQIRDKLNAYLNSGDCPRFAVELIRTGIELTNASSTLEWSSCVEYMQTLPALRGQPETFDFWINKYLP